MPGLWQPAGRRKGRICSLSYDYELAAIWRRYTFIKLTRVNSRNGFAVDNITINIVVVIIISYLLLQGFGDAVVSNEAAQISARLADVPYDVRELYVDADALHLLQFVVDVHLLFSLLSNDDEPFADQSSLATVKRRSTSCISRLIAVD